VRICDYDLRKKTVKSVAIREKVYGQWGDLKYYPAIVKNVQTSGLL